MNALPHDKKLQIKYPDVLKNPDINADKNTFASHHWYSENWSYGEQNQNTIVLPKIDDEPEILALPALEAYLDERMDDNN